MGHAAAAAHADPAGHARPAAAVIPVLVTAGELLTRYVPGPPSLLVLVPKREVEAAVCDTLTTNAPVLASAVAVMVAWTPALPSCWELTVRPVHGTVRGVQGFVESVFTVTMVPGKTPKPESVMVLVSTPPVAMAVMVIVVPEMKPVKVDRPVVYANIVIGAPTVPMV